MIGHVIRPVITAFAFLTRLPVRAGVITDRDLGRSVGFFPLVGLVLGLLTAGLAYVTPAGGAEQLIGSGYAFRSEQSGATSLANWAGYAGTGSMSLCNFTLASAGVPAPVNYFI